MKKDSRVALNSYQGFSSYNNSQSLISAQKNNYESSGNKMKEDLGGYKSIKESIDAITKGLQKKENTDMKAIIS